LSHLHCITLTVKTCFLRYSRIIFDKKSFGQRFAHPSITKRVEELARRLEKFEKEKKILCHEKAVLKAENKVMKAKVADLEARLESNSYNSY